MVIRFERNGEWTKLSAKCMGSIESLANSRKPPHAVFLNKSFSVEPNIHLSNL